MSIRTRRRISPRARRRYLQIRNFFQRTLSSLTSVSANRLNSSTTENNFHSAGRGCPLHAVPENYRSPTRPRDLGRRHTEELTPVGRTTNSPAQRRRRFSDRNMTQADTKLLYKTEDNLGCNSREYGLRCHNKLIRDREQNSSDMISYPQSTSSQHIPCPKQKKKKRDTFEKVEGRVSRLGKREGYMVIENSIFDSDSCESLAISIRRADLQASTSRCRQQDHDRCKIQPHEVRTRRRKDKPKRYKSKSPHDNKRKNKNNEASGKDDRFISDIINRQYKPLSFFGRKASDISQISTPVCRDKQYSTREMPIPDSEVSSFCRGPIVECANIRNMHSLSDLQSYTAPRPARHRRRRTENYNDSSIYDVVPVREKTSPKSRRKFIEDNLIFNEVPPSPRTQRPRLNLETQNYSDYEYYEQRENQSKRRRSPHPQMRPNYECEQTDRCEMSPEESPRTRPKFEMHLNNFSRLQDDIGTTMSSQHYLTSHNNTTSNTLDNSKILDREGTPSVDKTDKALSEIKNILQNFLQELKKDSSSSQCDHCDQASGLTAKNSANDETLRGSGNDTSNAMKNSAASSFNCSLGPTSARTVPAQFTPPGYVNPCCYSPMIPMFAPNGLPYVVASPSCVCATVACGHNHTQQQQADTQDVSFRTCSKANCTETDAAKTNCETDVLIREIYNYVTRNPSFDKTRSSKLPQDQFVQLPRAKETGKSMHALQHDAIFGTPPLRCYSKSCEAIVSRQHLNTYYATYPSYSDSLLDERLSQQTVVDCRMPRETNEHKFQEKKTPKVLEQHPQESKFVSALRLLRTRANKKKRTEVVHEVCDSEKSIEVDIVPKGRPQFRQDVNTYMMHGQEFYHAPPLRHDPHGPLSNEYDYSPYDPNVNEHRGPPPASERFPYHERMPPSAPYMYDNSFENRSHSIPSQVPLCLKEVEVRSVGIQSERKTTTFRLFSEKKDLKEVPKSSQTRFPVSILRKDRPQTSTSQKISFDKTTKPQKARKGFNFNKPAATSKSEPLTSFTDKMKEDITKNDKTVANAMLKKLFYKRNPFSPQNRFVRTVLEKDATEFKWRPRMFIF